MTDNLNNEPRLSEEKMDQLLHAFFQLEVPSQLERLPSSWPELRSGRSVDGVVAATESNDRTQRSSSGRRIVVTLASLAACVAIMIVANSGSEDRPENLTRQLEGPAALEPEHLLMPVHGGAKTGIVDDSNTTLQEIDGVDIAPEKASSKTDEANE